MKLTVTSDDGVSASIGISENELQKIVSALHNQWARVPSWATDQHKVLLDKFLDIQNRLE